MNAQKRLHVSALNVVALIHGAAMTVPAMEMISCILGTMIPV